MVVGFNHNFSYKGELYHIQTEDSGVRTPHIITLLYKGGTILASKKTSYADIIKIDNLEQVVEDLMKEQHRDMLRRLKSGDFDQLLGITTEAQPASAPVAAAATPPPKPATATTPPPPAPSAPASPPPATPPQPAAPVEQRRKAVLDESLDEIILSYMTGEDRKK